MKSHRTILGVLAALGLGILGLPAPVLGQTIYAPYAITNLGGSPGGTFFFTSPYDVAIYHSTNIYVAATYDYTIRKLTKVGGTNWVMTILAGAPNLEGTNDGVGAAARFLYPQCVTVDSDNNVFVADTGNGLIRKITPDGTVTTLAGGFSDPVGLAVDGSGYLYVSDYGSNTAIKKVSPGGGVSTLVSSAPGTVQYAGGVGLDSSNNVYVADSAQHVIWKVTPGGSPSIIAGSAGNPGSADGIASAARFYVPNDVAVNAAGDIFVADAGNSTLRRIRFDGSNWVVRTIAGTPEFWIRQRHCCAASFRNLAGLVVDDNTSILYAVDIVAGTLRAGVYVRPTNAFNSWTNSGDGIWEDELSWSAGVPPSVQDEENYLTNAGTKTVFIDADTVATSATNLTINNLTVSAPGNDVNALVLANAGTVKPLFMKQFFQIDSGGNVTLTNSAIKVGAILAVGYQNGNAILDIQGGGKVTAPEAYVGISDAGGSSVNVAGSGAAWTNQQFLVVGNYSHDNGVLIENGGRVVNLDLGAVGIGGNNNSVIVTGVGSLWRNASYLIIGDDGGNGNELTIQGGATAYVGYADNGGLDIGTGGGDSNTVFVADAGSLLTCSGPLQLTRGGSGGDNVLSILQGGKVVTTSLVVSNLNDVELSGATLETAGTTFDNGFPFFIGIGAEPTTLRLNGGTHTFADGLVVTDHAVLSGCGTIIGPVTVEPGRTVVADCGTLTFSGPVTNKGAILPINGTNVVFPGGLVNHGPILTNIVGQATCPIVVTGAIVNLMDSPPSPYVITDGTNSVQFNWSLAGPGASGYIYTTANTAIAAVTNVTTVNQITNAAAYTFLNSGNVGPLKDAGANGGNAQFVLLRHKTTGHYCAVRLDDVQANGRLNASWWFQSQAGSTNFGCVPPPPPPGPQPATNFTMQASGGNPTLSFATQPGRAYTVQMRTNLTTGPWLSITNFPGDGLPRTISTSPAERPAAYYRILTQ